MPAWRPALRTYLLTLFLRREPLGSRMVGDAGREGGHLVGGQVDGGHALAPGAVDLGEGARQVEGGAVRGQVQVHDRGVGARPQGGAGSVGGPDGGQAVGVGAVDLGEGAPDVQHGTVLGRLDGADGAVGLGGPVQELAGGDVIGQGARAGHLLGAGGGPGGAGLGEVPDGVDRVAHDLLVPHDAVDLRGRQGVGRDGLVGCLAGPLRVRPRWWGRHGQDPRQCEKGHQPCAQGGQGKSAAGMRAHGRSGTHEVDEEQVGVAERAVLFAQCVQVYSLYNRWSAPDDEGARRLRTQRGGSHL